jgi:serine/threonine-protein kinase
MKCPECGVENAADASACSACGARLLALAPGAVLAGRYEIQALLGSGALGRVYRARDRTLDEVVAVKVLDPETTRSAELAQRFRNEIRLARRVRHVNVCAIHEYGEDGPLHFVAMELVDGTDLRRTLLEKGPLPPTEVFDLALQMVRGLAAIHDAGVIHRDLKTSNIVRDRSGVVRLLDFGIAKHSTPTGTLALTGIQKVVGTPEYMSPEQIRGDDLDPRSDLYSFGVVLFELLTGTLPFEGKTPLDTMLRHISEPPPLYGDRAARIPPSLVSVLRRLLLKDPGGRPGSARELEAELLFAQRAAAPPLAGEASLPRVPAPSVPTLPPATPPPLPAVRPPRPSAPDGSPRHEPPPVDRTEVLPRRPAAGRLTPPPPPVVAARDAAAAAALDPERTYLELPTASGAADTGLQPPPLPGPPPSPPRLTSRRRVWLGSLAMITVAAIAVALVLRASQGSKEDRSAGAATEPRPQATLPSAEAASEASPHAGSPSPIAAETGPSTPAASTASSPTPGPQRPVAATTAIPTPSPGPLAAAAPSATPTPAPRRYRERVPPTPEPTPTPSPTPTPVPRARLDVVVRPWAEVEVDGKPYGRTPLDRLSLEPGEHSVEVAHPDYWPRRRLVRLGAGEAARLDVDLAWEAVARRRGGGVPNRLPNEGEAADAEVERGSEQLSYGDYHGAVATLETAAQRLRGQPGRRRELARAFFYLGVAYVELDRPSSATASFVAALEQERKLRPPPGAFSAKILGFFNHVLTVVKKEP